MRKYQLLSLIIVFCSTLSVFAQVPHTAQRYQLDNPDAAANATHYRPFVRVQNHDYDFDGIVKQAEVMRLRRHILERFYADAPKHARLTLPGADGQLVTLHLERNDKLIRELQVKVRTENDKYAYPYRESFHYWGKVVGQDTSLVSVSVFDNHLVVMYSTPGHDYQLGPAYNEHSNDDYIHYDGHDMLVSKEGHECKLPHDAADDLMPNHMNTRRTTQSCKTVRIYMEAGVSLYNDFSNSVTAVVDFSLTMYNLVALMYEVHNIPHTVSEIVVNTADPNTIDGAANAGIALTNFRSQLTAAGSFNGDLAHYITNSGNYGGGIAGLDAFCSFPSNSGINSSMFKNYQPIPSFSNNINILAHEIGHNHGDPHTQECGFWGSPARRFDDCYSNEGGGDCTPIHLIPALSDLGSLMSYCHISSDFDGGVNPGGVSFAVGFSDLPGLQAFNTYDAANCLSCPCSDDYEPNYSVATASTGVPVFNEVSRTENVSATLAYKNGQTFMLNRPSDYYLLVASEDGTMDLTLTNLPADFHLEILQTNGTSISSSENGGTTDETLSRVMSAGDTIIARVYPDDAAFSTSCDEYLLELDWAAVAACPSAGADSTLSVCNTGTQNLLTNGLAGAPAGTGSWTDNDATGALTGNVLDLSLLTSGTTYTFTYDIAAAGSCPALSATVTVDVAACTPTCTPTYTTSCAADPTPDRFFIEEYCISSGLGNLAKNSGDDPSCNRYTDNTGTTISNLLSVCGETEMNVDIAYRPAYFLFGSAPVDVIVYMDWNQDGDFNDVDEEFILNPSTEYNLCSGAFLDASPNFVSAEGTVTIPSSFQGGYCLMRLQMGHSMGGPCGNSTDDGETEDYLLYIEPASSGSLGTYAVSPATQTICENCRGEVVIENTDRNIQYALYDGTTAVTDTFVATGNEPLAIPVEGLAVGTHTLTARAVADGCVNTTDVDMANTVDVTVSNTDASGPETDNAPGNALFTHAIGNTSFSGDTSFVSVISDEKMNLSDATNGYTLSAWVQLTEFAFSRDYTIMSKGITGSLMDYEVGFNSSGQLYAKYGDPQVTITSTGEAFTTNEWYHIAVVRSAGANTLSLLVNGEEVSYASGNSTAGSTPHTSAEDWTYFARSCAGGQTQGATTYLPGYIDEVKLYREPMSGQEIREDMHLIHEGCAPDGLTAYFQFNELETTNKVTYDKYSRVKAYLNRNSVLDPSTLPVGKGTSTTITGINADGVQTFAGTDLEVDFTGVTGTYDLTVSKLDVEHNPNATAPTTTHPTLQTLMAPSYWVVNQFDVGTFTDAEMTFSNVDRVEDADITTPSNLKLFSRDSRAFGAWGATTDATSATRVSIPAKTADVVFPGITGFSQFGVGSLTEEVFPVELIDFNAQLVNTNDALLTWNTANELNNYGFAIEMQRPNAKTFEQQIFVPGAGTTNAPQAYKTTVPDLSAGLYFFRLRQIDYDGAETLSDLRSLQVIDDNTGTSIIVYPNPNDGSFTVAGEFADGTQANVVNMLGQNVWTGQLSPGDNSVALPVSRGVYILQIMIPGESMQSVRVVVE